MNHTVALPGSMIWMGIRLSSGSRPQSPKGRTGPLSLTLASYLGRYQLTISSEPAIIVSSMIRPAVCASCAAPCSREVSQPEPGIPKAQPDAVRRTDADPDNRHFPVRGQARPQKPLPPRRCATSVPGRNAATALFRFRKRCDSCGPGQGGRESSAESWMRKALRSKGAHHHHSKSQRAKSEHLDKHKWELLMTLHCVNLSCSDRSLRHLRQSILCHRS